MNNEKPSIYHNIINKNINNRRDIFSTLNEDRVEKKINNNIDVFTVEQKIYNIFKSPDFIYKADVTIVTKDGSFNKRIVGKVNNSLITIDNEKIPIDSIKDIYR